MHGSSGSGSSSKHVDVCPPPRTLSALLFSSALAMATPPALVMRVLFMHSLCRLHLGDAWGVWHTMGEGEGQGGGKGLGGGTTSKTHRQGGHAHATPPVTRG